MELVTGATGYVGSRLVRRLAARAAACARSRAAPSGWSACPAWSRSRGDLLGEARLAERSTAARPPTTSCTRWRPPTANGGGFAARDRRAADDLRRARPRTAGVERIVYLGGIAPAGAALAPPRAPGSRWRRSCSPPCPRSTALRASIVIGAGSSSFRVLVRLVERLRAAAAAALALEPHPADRRARRDRVPGAHPVGARGGRALARHLRPRRGHLRAQLIEGIAEALGVGRMPVGLPASLTPPASAVVAAVTRPAARARASADGEPRVRRAAARRARGGADLRHPPAPLRARGGARAGRVGVARAAGGPMKVERSVDVAAPPQQRLRRGDGLHAPGGLGDHPRPPGGRPAAPAREGLAAHPVPEARGAPLQGALDGGGERSLPRVVWEGRGPWRPTRGWSTGSSRTATARASRTSTSTTSRADRSAGWPERTVARATARELDGSLQRLKALVE